MIDCYSYNTCYCRCRIATAIVCCYLPFFCAYIFIVAVAVSTCIWIIVYWVLRLTSFRTPNSSISKYVCYQWCFLLRKTPPSTQSFNVISTQIIVPMTPWWYHGYEPTRRLWHWNAPTNKPTTQARKKKSSHYIHIWVPRYNQFFG